MIQREVLALCENLSFLWHMCVGLVNAAKSVRQLRCEALTEDAEGD